MSITVTITADNFQELFAMLRDVPMTQVATDAEAVIPLQRNAAEELCYTAPAVARATEPPVPDVVTIAPTETDIDGIEWNAEMHASSKAKTKDGKWRKKRGADDTPEPHTVAPVLEPVVQMPHTVAPPSNATTYADLLTLCSQKMGLGVLDMNVLATLQLEFGIDNITMLIAKPDMLTAFYARVQAL
jgi:hypothetical protein